MRSGLKYLLLSSILMFTGSTLVYAQPCLPDGITFSSQAQIDNFQSDYPNCTIIEGNLNIAGNDITNLNGLSVLTSIGGWISIHGTSLVDLSGLNNVTTTESLRIGMMTASGGNDCLVSLTGLNSLTSISGLFLLVNNIVLSDISAISNLSSVGSLSIKYNHSLLTLLGLNNLENVGGTLTIQHCDALQNFDGLDKLSSVSAGLYISNNENLIDLSGMDSLKYIGEILHIYANNALKNISSLSSLDSLEHGIYMVGNNQLTDISGLMSIDSFSGGGMIDIGGNQSLSSLSGLDSINAESIELLNIRNNGMLSECALKSICNYIADPQGSLWIYDNDTGCNSVAEVEDACIVGINEQQLSTYLSVYPNPFTTYTTIEYELTEPTNVHLIIYNAVGEEVYRAEDRLMPVGKHTFTWSPDRLPEGLYYAVLRSEDGVSVVKMVKQ